MELTDNGVLVSHENLEILRQRLEESQELTEQLETLKREHANEKQILAAELDSVHRQLDEERQVQAIEIKRAVRAAIAGTCAEADSARECHDAELNRARADVTAAQRLQLDEKTAHREMVENLEALIDELKSQLGASVRICETEKRRADAIKSSRDQIEAELQSMQEGKHDRRTVARREIATNTEESGEQDNCNQSLILESTTARQAVHMHTRELNEIKDKLAASTAHNVTLQLESDRMRESLRSITTNVEEPEMRAVASPARTTMAPSPVALSSGHDHEQMQNAINVASDAPSIPIVIVIKIELEHEYERDHDHDENDDCTSSLKVEQDLDLESPISSACNILNLNSNSAAALAPAVLADAHAHVNIARDDIFSENLLDLQPHASAKSQLYAYADSNSGEHELAIEAPLHTYSRMHVHVRLICIYMIMKYTYSVNLCIYHAHACACAHIYMHAYACACKYCN